MVYEPRPQEGSPLESAIREIDSIIKDQTTTQASRFVLRHALEGLQEVQNNVDSRSPHRTVRYLFDLYVRLQAGVQATPDAAHILRVVGDDQAEHLGYDSDEAWQDYQDALDAAH